MLLPLRSLYESAPDVTVNLVGVAASPAIGTARIDVTFAVTGVAASPAIGNQAIDSYSESNQDSFAPLHSTSNHGFGQCFTGNGQKIVDTRWYLRKHSVPTGNAVAKIWTMTGTFGVNGNIGTLLATSDNFDVSTLSSVFALATFTFSGADQYVTTNGARYVVTFQYSGGNGSNYIEMGYDGSSATHPGTWTFTLDDVTWTPTDAGIDLIFYVDRAGIGLVNVTYTVSGVSATPAIGVGAFNSNFSLSGVVAGAAVGVTRIDVNATLGSVSASPAIGTGTVTIGSGAADVFVNLVGVAATPAIGTGTIEGVTEDVQYGATAGFRPTKRRKKLTPIVLPPPTEYVYARGVTGESAIGSGVFGAVYLLPSGPLPSSAVGSSAIEITADLLDDELFALLELAA